MAWSTPRTWVPSETVTASLMNAHLRDNLNILKTSIGDDGKITRTGAIVIGIGDAAGDVISTGVKAFVPIPVNAVITGWTLIADAVGDLVIDVWKDTYANAPPTVADTIAGSEKPTLSSAQKGQDLSLSTWTTTITAGDVLGVKVDSCATIKQATLTLHVDVTE